jgi:hypothetical protein
MNTFYAVPGSMIPGAIWPGEPLVPATPPGPAVVFAYGTPYFEWTYGDPVFEWETGDPYLS